MQQGMYAQNQPIFNQPMSVGFNQQFPNNMMGGQQQFMQQQPQVGYVGPGQPMLNDLAGNLLNQVNPDPFSNSGIPQLQPLMPLQPMAGIPLGLELLLDLDQITVKQKAEFLEVMTGFETANRYNVLNATGQRIYFAGETTDKAALCCGGVQRPFKITIVDFSGRVVLQLERPCDPALYITTSCWPCCCCLLGTIGGKVSVTMADGTKLGEICHSFSCYQPNYEVLDAGGQRIMSIKGPQCGDCCLCTCVTCGTTDFPVILENGQELGKIKKKFTGFQELVTDADTFGVNFPKDLDVKWKALIFGAVFLIDFMYFEEPTNQQQRPAIF